MFRYIEKLQQEPAHKRKQIAIIVALGITSLIALVWLSTLKERFTSPETKTINDNRSPFAIIGEQVRDFKSIFKGQLEYFKSERGNE